jgi:hydrogenase maturation protease
MKVVVCGIGNTERGDDAFGPLVVERLREGETLRKIDCGLYPENYLNRMVTPLPDLVLFLDTIGPDEERCVLLRNEEIASRSPLSVSAHNLSLTAMYELLKESGVKDVLFIGVPVRSYSKISARVKVLADRIISALNNIDKTSGFDIIKMYAVLSEQLR